MVSWKSFTNLYPLVVQTNHTHTFRTKQEDSYFDSRWPYIMVTTDCQRHKYRPKSRYWYFMNNLPTINNKSTTIFFKHLNLYHKLRERSLFMSGGLVFFGNLRALKFCPPPDSYALIVCPPIPMHKNPPWFACTQILPLLDILGLKSLTPHCT